MPRLFFALTLPDTVADQLDELCEGIPRAHWLSDGDYHLTLSFLGEVTRSQRKEAIEVARTIRRPPFELQLGSVGVFPHRGQPRVLWSGVKKQEALFGIQRALQNELRHAGFEIERRKFPPHVTLARIQQSPPEATFDWIGRHLSFSSAVFKVHRFHLFSSTLTSAGSRYELEESFRLQGLV